MIVISVLRITVLLLAAVVARPVMAQQNVQPPPYVFVKEFIRGLGALDRIRAQGEADAKKPGANTLAIDVRSNTQALAELKAQITALQAMKLAPPNGNVPGQFAQLYQMKADATDSLKKLGELKLNGPQPGVDYTKGEVSIPKLRDNLESLDGVLYQVTSLVFATLIGEEEDAQGRKHLVITKAQKATLIGDLEKAFGARLKQKDQKGVVAPASALLNSLRDSSYKSSDEK